MIPVLARERRLCKRKGLNPSHLDKQQPHTRDQQSQKGPHPTLSSPHTRLLVGRQVLLKLDAQHLVLLAYLGQCVLQLDNLCA